MAAPQKGCAGPDDHVSLSRSGHSGHMRQVLLHYHILKNGGSSIIEILRRSYWGTFSEFDLADRDAEIKPA